MVKEIDGFFYKDYRGKTFLLDSGAEITCLADLPGDAEKQEVTVRVYGFNKTQAPVCSNVYLWKGLSIIPNQSDNLMTLRDARAVVGKVRDEFCQMD